MRLERHEPSVYHSRPGFPIAGDPRAIAKSLSGPSSPRRQGAKAPETIPNPQQGRGTPACRSAGPADPIGPHLAPCRLCALAPLRLGVNLPADFALLTISHSQQDNFRTSLQCHEKSMRVFRANEPFVGRGLRPPPPDRGRRGTSPRPTKPLPWLWPRATLRAPWHSAVSYLTSTATSTHLRARAVFCPSWSPSQNQLCVCGHICRAPRGPTSSRLRSP